MMKLGHFILASIRFRTYVRFEARMVLSSGESNTSVRSVRSLIFFGGSRLGKFEVRS